MQQMILQPQAEGNGCIKSRCGSHCKKRFDFGKRLAHLENAQQSHRTDQQEQQCICLCLFTGQTEQAHDMKQQVKQEADTNGNGIRGGSPNNVINLKRPLNGKQNVWKYQNGEEKSDSDGREKDV